MSKYLIVTLKVPVPNVPDLIDSIVIKTAQARLEPFYNQLPKGSTIDYKVIRE